MAVDPQMCAISLVVRIAAFQAVDPGSNPGWRITIVPRTVGPSFLTRADQCLKKRFDFKFNQTKREIEGTYTQKLNKSQ